MIRGPRGLIRLQCVLFISITLLISSSGCGGGGNSGSGTTPNPTPTPTPTPVVTLTTITVTPANASIVLGTTQQLSATGNYSDGSTKDLTSTVTWTSSTPTIVTIGASGLATSKTQGTVTISAASGSITGSTALTVGPHGLTGIVITPGTATVALGLTQQFSAQGTFTDGTTYNISVTWTSTATDVATIDAGGLMKSTGQGNTTISAALSGVSASASVTVGPPQRASRSVLRRPTL